MVLSLETYISLLDLDNVTALHSSQVDSAFLQLLNGGGRDWVPWRVVSVCIWRCVCLALQHCFIFVPNLCSFWCMLLRIVKSLWFSHLIMKFPGFNWKMWVRCIVLQGACSKSVVENIVVSSSRWIDGLHTLEVLLSLVRHIYVRTCLNPVDMEDSDLASVEFWDYLIMHVIIVQIWLASMWIC